MTNGAAQPLLISGYIIKQMKTNKLMWEIQTIINYWFKAVVLPDRR